MIIEGIVVCLWGLIILQKNRLKELEKNPYVKKVSNKSITYAKEFKELYWIDYQNGIQPIEIFKKIWI